MMMPTSILIAEFYHYRCFFLFAPQASEGRLDGLGIDAAHQLADVLLLAAQSAPFRDSLGLEHRLEQCLIEVHCPKIILLQRNERFAELLPRQVVAFPFAFTGLCIIHRLKYLPRPARDPGAGVYHGNNDET